MLTIFYEFVDYIRKSNKASKFGCGFVADKIATKATRMITTRILRCWNSLSKSTIIYTCCQGSKESSWKMQIVHGKKTKKQLRLKEIWYTIKIISFGLVLVPKMAILLFFFKMIATKLRFFLSSACQETGQVRFQVWLERY